jgi:hypothetical protein
MNNVDTAEPSTCSLFDYIDVDQDRTIKMQVILAFLHGFVRAGVAGRWWAHATMIAAALTIVVQVGGLPRRQAIFA